MRRGFTIVELLVAMVILAVLTALVVSALEISSDDRVSASSRSVQSFIAGARSRAAVENRDYGVRLVSTSSDPRLIDSLELIRVPDPHSGTCTLEHSGGAWRMIGTFANLGIRGLLRDGMSVEIPAESGSWHYIETVVSFSELQLAGHYNPSEFVSGVYFANPPTLDPATGARIPPTVEFRLKLPPIGTGRSISLERGTVIDLDSSQVDSGDILFTPNGETAGRPAIVSLYVTTLEDVELTRLRFPGHPANGGALSPPIVSAAPGTVPATEPSVVTIRPYGQIEGNGTVDFTDVNGDGQADSPFRISVRGI